MMSFKSKNRRFLLLIVLLLASFEISIIHVNAWAIDKADAVTGIQDGDTFYIDTESNGVRLADIDAPEEGNSGYSQAINALSNLIGGNTRARKLVNIGDKREILAILSEITQRKRMVEEMRGHSEHLEALVEEKTGELLDAERLITAGKVASMVGHDLRGPLQTINNALYIMKNTPEKTVEAQEMTRKAVQRAAGMLEELRNQTREADLNLVPTDLAALIRTIVEETQIPESVNVTLEAGDGLGDVSLDPIQMRRVLDNLIGNAVDAMPKGGKLTVVAMKEDGGFRITVSDTGVGIPEEEMSNLFKLFYTTKSDGMGLGLTFCKRVVEAHGGTITVESEVDEGTTFTIKMPLKLK